jgi:DNA polymerase sigma
MAVMTIPDALYRIDTERLGIIFLAILRTLRTLCIDLPGTARSEDDSKISEGFHSWTALFFGIFSMMSTRKILRHFISQIFNDAIT